MTRAFVPEPGAQLTALYGELLAPSSRRGHLSWLVAAALAIHALLFAIPTPPRAVVPPTAEKEGPIIDYRPPPLPPRAHAPEPVDPKPKAKPLLVPVPDRSPDEVEPVVDEARLVEDLRIPEVPTEVDQDFDPGDAVAAAVGPSSSRAELLAFDEPDFPRCGKELGLTEQLVKVFITVGRDGRVKDARYLSGHPCFEAEVMEQVKGWQFKPATVDGQPVESVLVQPFKFILRK